MIYCGFFVVTIIINKRRFKSKVKKFFFVWFVVVILKFNVWKGLVIFNSNDIRCV